MQLFLKKTFILISIFLISFLILLTFWIVNNYQEIDYPAPNLSNSYSFNEKMLFMNKNKLNNDLDILAIGSSMSLNNLHSNTITRQLNSENYINASSWGLNMTGIFYLLETLKDIYKPKTLIIASNFCDFRINEKTIRYELLEGYLQSQKLSSFYYYLKPFNRAYYFGNAKYAKKVRNGFDEYDYLGYDKYGGVNLESEGFNIKPKRWDGPSVLIDNIDSVQYQYLDKICLFCKKNNIMLYFFQSPIRIGYFKKLKEKEKDILDSHTHLIQKTLHDYKFTFVNSNDTTWSDSLFVDWIHLNENGAKIFTEYCLIK